MSKDDKREIEIEFDVEEWVDPTHTTENLVRKILPLGMRVLVRIIPDTNRTEAGLYLPEGAKQSTQESLMGEVVEVASAVDDESYEETNISGIPAGAKVLISADIGTRVPWEDDLRIVDTKDVLAIVHEVGLN